MASNSVILLLMFLSIKVGRLVSTSTNRLWQKACCVTSRAMLKHLFLKSWSTMLAGLQVGSLDETEWGPAFLPFQPRWQTCKRRGFQISSTPSHLNYPSPQQVFPAEASDIMEQRKPLQVTSSLNSWPTKSNSKSKCCCFKSLSFEAGCHTAIIRTESKNNRQGEKERGKFRAELVHGSRIKHDQRMQQKCKKKSQW